MPHTHARAVEMVELENLERESRRTLLVHLPTSEGRSRVAFVPMRHPDAFHELQRTRLIEQVMHR